MCCAVVFCIEYRDDDDGDDGDDGDDQDSSIS
jgi:hypothetical protein